MTARAAIRLGSMGSMSSIGTGQHGIGRVRAPRARNCPEELPPFFHTASFGPDLPHPSSDEALANVVAWLHTCHAEATEH